MRLVERMLFLEEALEASRTATEPALCLEPKSVDLQPVLRAAVFGDLATLA